MKVIAVLQMIEIFLITASHSIENHSKEPQYANKLGTLARVTEPGAVATGCEAQLAKDVRTSKTINANLSGSIRSLPLPVLYRRASRG